MDDKVSTRRQLFCNKVKESERAVEYDRECLQKDAEKYQQKHTYLKQFRDANKSVSSSSKYGTFTHHDHVSNIKITSQENLEPYLCCTKNPEVYWVQIVTEIKYRHSVKLHELIAETLEGLIPRQHVIFKLLNLLM